MDNRVVICPKCKEFPIRLIEIWKGHSISWEYNGKNLTDPVCEVGDPYKVNAYCICGHRWKVRGVTQITEIGVNDEV